MKLLGLFRMWAQTYPPRKTTKTHPLALHQSLKSHPCFRASGSILLLILLRQRKAHPPFHRASEWFAAIIIMAAGFNMGVSEKHVVPEIVGSLLQGPQNNLRKLPHRRLCIWEEGLWCGSGARAVVWMKHNNILNRIAVLGIKTHHAYRGLVGSEIREKSLGSVGVE